MLLLKTIPLDAEEEELLELEPLLLLEFIRQLFMKTAKMKADVQLEMEEKKEFGCAEYEPQLQKLEADIREHIKVFDCFAENLCLCVDKDRATDEIVCGIAAREIR